MKAIIAFSALVAITTANPLLSPRVPSPQCTQCNPFPDYSGTKCDITTSCVPKTQQTLYCACRAGYKADPKKYAGDLSAQWRLFWPGQEGRVFVRPGVVCDTLCDGVRCDEVYLNGSPAC